MRKRSRRAGRLFSAVTVFYALSICVATAGGMPDHPDVILGGVVEPINLTAKILEGRIVLLWQPANALPSGGMKISRASSSEFTPESLDLFTKWLPGTGYKQAVLPATAASETAFFYRVASLQPGEPPRLLGLSNVVRVEPLKTNQVRRAEPLRTAPEHEVWREP